MIFFFWGRPRRFQWYQTSLTMVSLASEPELQKKARSSPSGVSAARRAASWMAGSLAWARKPWA